LEGEKMEMAFNWQRSVRGLGNPALERGLEMDLVRLCPSPIHQFDISIKGNSNTTEVVIEIRREHPFMSVSSLVEDFGGGDTRNVILQRVADLVAAFNEEEPVT
jgi:lipoate synthase